MKGSVFGVRKDEGPDKLLSLEEAAAKYVRPGMVLHVGDGANAAVRQILLRSWGSKPGFTLIASSAEDYVLDMVHGGQVKRLIFSLSSESYPTRGPSKIMQRAFRENAIEIENWSLHTIVQRLMAGAMGLPFMPSKSLLDSTTATENEDGFMEIADPFGTGQKVGLVKPLHPDLSLIHALAADRAGNAIPAPSSSSGQGVWGALASREGVVVTTEKIVSTDFIRRHSHLVQIPGYLVRSVSLTPKGAHPQGLFNLGLARIDSYGEDREFMQEHRKATQSGGTLNTWIDDWVLRCPSHEAYLQKLGEKGSHTVAIRQPSFRSRFGAVAGLPSERPYHGTDTMIVIAARKIMDRLNEEGYLTVLTGTGISMLASWLAYYQLRDKRPEVQLVTGAGLFGYTPFPGEPQRAGSISNMRTAKMISDTLHLYGVFIGGQNNQCLSVLGSAEIDRWGNINTSQLPGKVFLTGGGGASDAVNAREVIVVSHQSRERFVEKVAYVTCSGKNVRAVVSDRGLFEKIGQGRALVLTGYFKPREGVSEVGAIAEIKNECGWDLRVSPKIQRIPPPTIEELTLLQILDPKGLFHRRPIKRA